MRARGLCGGGGLTQGLENASCILRGTDGLEVQWQGRVVAHGGLGTLVLQAGAGHPLTHQVIQLLHRFQLDLEALVLEEEGALRHHSLSREGGRVLPGDQGAPLFSWSWKVEAWKITWQVGGGA